MDDERDLNEEQVEDLDPPAEDAEAVKGGKWFSKVEGPEPPPPPPPRP
jgi:hypothetical protein